MGQKTKNKIKRLIISFLAVSLVCDGFLFSWQPREAEAATQNAYRWRNDDGSETSATWAAAENTALTGLSKNTAKRLRFGAANTASESELLRQAATALNFEEGTLRAAVIDTVNGYA